MRGPTRASTGECEPAGLAPIARVAANREGEKVLQRASFIRGQQRAHQTLSVATVSIGLPTRLIAGHLQSIPSAAEVNMQGGFFQRLFTSIVEDNRREF